MTETQARLDAVPGSRLEELLACYESAKAAAAEAKDRFEGIAAALKSEMAAAAPGCTTVGLSGAPGLPRLRLRWRESYRCDVRRFKLENPAEYVRYEVKSGTWELREDAT